MTLNSTDWHLDRKVTITIILTLLVNAGSSLWWASRLDYTVQNHETRLLTHDREIDDIRIKSSAIFERLARIEANQTFQSETLREIKDAIAEGIKSRRK